VTVTVTDLFCGAGGSSLGAEFAGAQLVMAANHWQTAIDVHQAHFPDAGHDCADISQADPRRYPATVILLASPECTNHSQARGVSRRRQDPTLWDAPDPAAERSRATMWDVPRFAEQNRYAAVIVENVVEATKWVMWPAWWQAMELLGYRGVVLSHNSMHHGVAQSRDRIYVVWARRGLSVDLELELEAWCPRCESARVVRQAWKNGRTVGRYRQQWLWTATCGHACEPSTEPAASIIDWALPCPRIGDRAKPLADNTRSRILAGLQRFGFAPVITAGAGNVHERTPGNRARPVTEPLATQTTTAQHALATGPDGFLFNTAHGGRVSDLTRPHPTVCASDDRNSLIVPMRRNGHARSVESPVPTVTAGGCHHGLLMRNNRGGAEMVTPTSEPARTMTTTVTTRDRCALIDPDEIVDDCGFRMLEPHEIAAAMAFPDGYIPDDLTKKDRVRLAGNAVTPPVMAWIVGRVLQALEVSA
jgi:DNA (cytosine-5)-methyltransferase 1